MTYRKTVGRPTKVNWSVIMKLADSLQHNSTITDACRYAGISRDTFYRHMHNDVFAAKIEVAKSNQTKAVFSFLTVL